MFGGANSQSADRVPADILVEGNHFSKPLDWKGTPRAVKNLFELKSAKRVTIRSNLFERNWTDAQDGFAILFTVRNDEGGAPWSVVEDVLFERNIIRDTEGVVKHLGRDGYKPSGRTRRASRSATTSRSGTAPSCCGGEVGTLTLDRDTVDRGGRLRVAVSGRRLGARRPGQAAGAVCRWIVDDYQHGCQPQRVHGSLAKVASSELLGFSNSREGSRGRTTCSPADRVRASAILRPHGNRA